MDGGLSLPGIVLQSPLQSRPGTGGSHESGGNMHLSLGVVVKTYARSCMPSDTRSLGNSENSRVLKRILHSTTSTRDGDISFINDGDNMSDELTQNSMPLAKQIHINPKFENKPLPGFIRLAPGAPRHESVLRMDNVLKASVNDCGVVQSSHTMQHAGLEMRRGATDQPMDERRRATSPVSSYRERNRIEGFREPPRDYLKALSPVDRRLVLKKYGYGSSPKKKGEMLEKTIVKRYAGTDLLHSINDKAGALKAGVTAKSRKGSSGGAHAKNPNEVEPEFESLDNLFETSLNNLSTSQIELEESLDWKTSRKPVGGKQVPPGMIVEIDAEIDDTGDNVAYTLESVSESVNPEVQPGATSKKLDAETISVYSVPSASQQKTGLPLSKGTGSKVKSRNAAKISPAVRRRIKEKAEKAKLGGAEGRKPIVIKQAPDSALNSIKLRNPTERSIHSADPRPGALAPSSHPYYEASTYRMPVTLEDKLRNMPEADGDVDLLSFASLDEYSTDASLQQLLPEKQNEDQHAWRKPFLTKKIRFPDSLDSDSDNDNAFGINDEADNFDFNAELEIDEENSEDGEELPEGMQRELVMEAKEAVFDEDGNEVEPAQEAVYEIVPIRSAADSTAPNSAAPMSAPMSDAGTAPGSQRGSAPGSQGGSTRSNNGNPENTDDYVSIKLDQDATLFPGSEPDAVAGVIGAGPVPETVDNKVVGTDTLAPLSQTDVSQDPNPSDSPDGRVSTAAGLDASISLVRASIDNGIELPPTGSLDGSRPLSIPASSLSHVSSVMMSEDEGSEISSQIGFGSGVASMTSSAHRHSVQNAADLEEQRKLKRREAYRAKMRAKKMKELEEEESNKQALFIANHVDPVTAKRIDYKFPDHGIQVPGVGEAHTQYRDYAADSMFLGTQGAIMTQKDPYQSTLLDTVLLDVRLTSPVYGDLNARPISPQQRETVMSRQYQDTMFSLKMSGAPPTPVDISHRKLNHQIVLLTEQMRQNADLSAEPFISYGKPYEDVQNSIPASQRFRMEAEEMRLQQEADTLARTQAKMDLKAEKDKLALEAAGIKAPRRKKLQVAKPKATVEGIPVAYSVGATRTGGVGCSVVSTHPPSLVYKAKKRYTKEFKPPSEMEKTNLIPVSHKGGSEFRPPQFRISKGVVVYTRDNQALDPQGGLIDLDHDLWGGETANLERDKDKRNIADLLAMNTNMRSREADRSREQTPKPRTGESAGPGSATGSVKLKGDSGSVGSAGSGSRGAARQKSAGLAAESTISLNSGVSNH